MRIADIGFVERPCSTGGGNLCQSALSCCFVPMVMDSDRPAGRRKSQADRPTNPSGRAGHKHRMSLVDLVHLVCLVYLVSLVHLVGPVQPNKRNKQDKPHNDPIMGGMSW